MLRRDSSEELANTKSYRNHSYVQQPGSWADPAERANSGFADPLNLIQVMLAKGERRVFLRWFYLSPSVD